jgi:L-lactate dehydrogenase complex protein LldG
MTSREQILTRLRRASIEQKLSSAAPVADKSLFKDYPHKNIEIFIEKFEALSGEIHFAKNREEAANRLLSLIDLSNKTACLIQPAPLCKELVEVKPQLEAFMAREADLQQSSPEFASYEMGVTTADYLVARTGSIVLNARHMGGRRLSVLPPTHVVLATQDQIMPSLEDVLQVYAAAEKDWSYATIITGASRTADIEKILVLGAHGPKRLVLILIDR